MKKMRKITAYFMIFTFFAVFSVAKAESFDPEAISQVSKRIAEWKLMNKDKDEKQVEPAVYVSSSLSGVIEKGGSEGVGVIEGLAAFDNDYWIKSQIRQWELNRTVDMSNRYISRLPDIWDVNKVLTKTAMKTTLGVGVKGTTLSPIWTPVSTVESTYSLGKKITATYGTSMQIMNPPIYLNEKTSWGWKGEGSYSFPGGVVNYQETLKTAGPGPITRTHTDWVTTNTGTYIRQVEIKTIPENRFERFMMHHYPVGGYFDPDKTTITTITRSQQSYRIETVGGISKVTPLPSSGFGKSYGGVGSNWNSPPPTFNATWKTVKMGSTTYKYPSIDWRSIPKTNWNIPTYTPSMPKMPTYTPRMPSSSWGRKY